MGSALLIAVLILLSTAPHKPPQRPNPSQQNREFHGTLIVFTHTKEGLVICADKRLSYDADHYHDDVVKIIPVGQQAAFAVAGVPFIEVHDGGPPFNTIDIINEYFSRTKFQDTKEFWTGLEQALFNNFVQYIEARRFENWPPTLLSEANNYFFQSLFFYLDDQGKTKIGLIPLKYIKEQGPLIQVKKFTMTTEGLFEAVGEATVAKELRNGNDPRFDDVRADALLKPFLLNLLPPSRVTTQRAIAFSKRLIKISAERAKWVGDQKNGISATCDCALISPKEGFKWLAQNESVNQFPTFARKPKRPRH